MEFLVHSGILHHSEGTLYIWAVTDARPPVPAEWALSLNSEKERPVVGLGIGVGSQQGNIAGVVRLDPDMPPLPLDRVRIVGPQMPVLNLTETSPRTFRPL